MADRSQKGNKEARKPKKDKAAAAAAKSSFTPKPVAPTTEAWKMRSAKKG